MRLFQANREADLETRDPDLRERELQIQGPEKRYPTSSSRAYLLAWFHELGPRELGPPGGATDYWHRSPPIDLETIYRTLADKLLREHIYIYTTYVYIHICMYV